MTDRAAEAERAMLEAVEALPIDDRAAAYLVAHRRLQERLGVASA